MAKQSSIRSRAAQAPNAFNLDSKSYPQPVTPNPEPRANDVLPKPGDYMGAMKASDAATVLAPMGSPKEAVPGSGMPGEPWRSVNPEPRKRGAFRG
jgi:hypothetical protein